MNVEDNMDVLKYVPILLEIIDVHVQMDLSYNWLIEKHAFVSPYTLKLPRMGILSNSTTT